MSKNTFSRDMSSIFFWFKCGLTFNLASSTQLLVGSIFSLCLPLGPSKFLSEHGKSNPHFQMCFTNPLCPATSLQSLEIACDTILSGQVKVMIDGGFDSFRGLI